MVDTEEQTVPLGVAQQVVLENATAEGRCPQCGRRHDAQEGKLFDQLRSELADARTERDDARKDLQAAQDSNVLYEAEVARLTALVKEDG